MKYSLPVKYSEHTSYHRRKIREQYVQEQDGKCYWCKELLTDTPTKDVTSKTIDLRLFPPGFLKNPVHLQHDHDTDMTEGAVHAYCNAVMWQYYGR